MRVESIVDDSIRRVRLRKGFGLVGMDFGIGISHLTLLSLRRTGVRGVGRLCVRPKRQFKLRRGTGRRCSIPGAAIEEFCIRMRELAHLDLAGGNLAQDEFFHFRQRVLHLGHDRL